MTTPNYIEAEILKDLLRSGEDVLYKNLPITTDLAEMERAQSRWDRTPWMIKTLYKYAPFFLALILLYQSYGRVETETFIRYSTFVFMAVVVFYLVGFSYFQWTSNSPSKRRLNLIVTNQRVISFADGFGNQNPAHMVVVEKNQIKRFFMDYHEGSTVLKLQTQTPVKPVIIARDQIDQAKSAIQKLLAQNEVHT